MMGSKKKLSAEKGPFYNDESKMETTQKLLIPPMLLRGRAQVFCFDESATGRADSLAV